MSSSSTCVRKKLNEHKLELLILGSAHLQLGEVLGHAKGKIKGKVLIIGPIGGGKYSCRQLILQSLYNIWYHSLL